jgi:hypothetical protein
MDSSEAAFYGLDTVSLENSAGQFEAPTASNLDAAEADLTPCVTPSLACPADTYRVDYATPTADAYPMPDITYALVPTSPQQPQVAKAMTDLLTNLVTYSHSSPTLPTGYAPLSDTLYKAALADIAADITAGPVTTPQSTTTPSTTTGTSSGTNTPSDSNATGEGGLSGSSALGGGDLGPYGSTPFTSPGSLDRERSAGGGSGGTESVGGSAVPTGFLLVSLDDPSRYLLPALIVLGVLCLVAGPLLLWGPALWRRRRRVGGHP